MSPGRRFPSPSARAESGGGGPDLTPPATPSPQVLTSGTTSLGSTSIGSWSDTVTVAATVTASSGSPPTATVTGSGAGPYSVSIASGLADGRSYAVRLRGTGADGQVADVVLLVAVATAVPAPAWNTLVEYDLTTVDTATAVTATGGDVALTVGGAAFLTLKTIFGSGTGSLTPTNGSGVIFAGSGGGIRSAFVNIDWATLGAVLDTETLAILIEFGFTSIISGGTILATAATVNANVNANHNFGGRWSLAGTTYAISPRYYNSSSTIGTAVSSGTTAFSGTYSAAMIVGPGGQTVYMHAGALPTDPPGFGFGPRRYSQPVSTWTSGSLTFPAGPPKPMFWVEDAVCVWRKIRIMRWS